MLLLISLKMYPRQPHNQQDKEYSIQMNINLLTNVLLNPTPEAVWQLQADLLAAGHSLQADEFALLDAFYHYLTAMQANLTSQGYTQLASYLSIGAAGMAVLEGGMAANLSLLQIMREGLTVLSSRQYIKGSTAEIERTIRDSSWFLYRAFWQLSSNTQASLSRDRRRQQLDDLFAPLQDGQTETAVKGILVGRLFQAILIMTLHAASQ